MASVSCPCGLQFDSLTSPAVCPQCGKTSAEDKIRFFCDCGAKLSATARFVGRTLDCPACGQAAPVPPPGTAPRPATTRRHPGASTVRRPPARPDGWRSIARFSMLFALIPLAIFTFFPPEGARKRIDQFLKENPEVRTKLRGKDLTPDTLCKVIPSRRIDGASFARTTSVHWILALLTALVFWEFILIIQPMGNSTSRQLWAVGIFTGTIGILMLLIVTITSILAEMIHIPILGFFGYSYRMAVEPGNGFMKSMIGFTLGVGFLEELCKALPLYWHYRKSATLDARGAVVWGLATGIGFGVSEGISYSKSFYHGIYGGEMYVVRFISCVSLHAVWSATVAILIWKRQSRIHNLEKFYQWIPIVFVTLSSSMVIHGFYDTCLKKEYGTAALASAILSFVLFFWLYDRACRSVVQARLAPEPLH